MLAINHICVDDIPDYGLMAQWLMSLLFLPKVTVQASHAHFFSALYLASSFTPFQLYILMCPPIVLSTFFTLLISII